MPVTAALVAGLAIALAVAACGRETPVASFDPASACATDGRFAGAYPELEALLPTAYEGKAPETVDSGRSCTDAALGTLAGAGVDGVRFAGATWALGGTSGVTVAVFEGDGLDASKLLTFYEAGAERPAGPRSSRCPTRPSAAPMPSDSTSSARTAPARRSSPGRRTSGRVRVLLAADIGDARVAEALEALGGD